MRGFGWGKEKLEGREKSNRCVCVFFFWGEEDIYNVMFKCMYCNNQPTTQNNNFVLECHHKVSVVTK